MCNDNGANNWQQLNVSNKTVRLSLMNMVKTSAIQNQQSRIHRDESIYDHRRLKSQQRS